MPFEVDLSTFDFSSLDQWLECGKRFQLLYRDKIPRVVSPSLLEGSACHDGLEAYNRRVLEGTLLSATDMAAIFRTSLTERSERAERQAQELRGSGLVWEDSLDFMTERAERWYSIYLKDYAKMFPPVKVEESFKREAKDSNGEPYTLVGRVDLVTPWEVLDYKTGKRAKTGRDTVTSLQLSLYSWAFEKEDVAFLTFVKSKRGSVKLERAKRTQQDWDWALTVFGEAVSAIRKGIFPYTTPSNPLCSKAYCPVYNACLRSKISPEVEEVKP
jgi:hypothetical protein